ncbi:START domain-containing protein 10 isoform X2 [Aethina tumida]|uniref:START domain-containing protein 10 isoform X2 n=1 Tax=Aethina tumida TaxID=116153 RepID=UPI002147F28E|nr:START domain-containing protein 10 isoform X2 [Aethina tumida]
MKNQSQMHRTPKRKGYSHVAKQNMEPGVVKIAEDSDFDMLKSLVDSDTDWKLEYDKGGGTKVWSKPTKNCSFNMVKIHTVFPNVNANTLFDVLLDPDYRKDWDEHMLQSIEIGYLNPNNDIGYYSLFCPSPVKNRDFVLQRSWLDMGSEKLILNHSIEHKDYPPKKGFVRAISYLTGYVIRSTKMGCFLGYISQTDPRGKLPSWLCNKLTQKFAPKVVQQLLHASQGYENWKHSQINPNYKPWVYPELTLDVPRVSVKDCKAVTAVSYAECEDDES